MKSPLASAPLRGVRVLAAVAACACHDAPASVVDAAPDAVSDAQVDAAPRPNGESWVWLFEDYANGIAAVGANGAAFTHVSPTLYTINYAYSSGVPYYTTCPMANGACTSNGPDDFGGGLTSAQIAQKIAATGLSCVPLVFAGARNDGVDTGLQRLLDDAPAGTRAAFIDAMVGEATTKGYAGYNLDFEAGPKLDATYAPKLVAFVDAFAAKLHPLGMSLSIDVIGSNVLQSNCSGVAGVVDLPKLAASSVDRVVFEDYASRLGTPSSACAKVPNPATCGDDFTGFLNLVCTYVPAGKTVIALESLPTASNPFAGAALAAMQSYGLKRVAVWPGSNVDGPAATYAFLDTKQLSPAGTWYALLQPFIQ
jgi:hypothetical protein